MIFSFATLVLFFLSAAVGGSQASSVLFHEQEEQKDMVDANVVASTATTITTTTTSSSSSSGLRGSSQTAESSSLLIDDGEQQQQQERQEDRTLLQVGAGEIWGFVRQGYGSDSGNAYFLELPQISPNGAYFGVGVWDSNSLTRVNLKICRGTRCITNNGLQSSGTRVVGVWGVSVFVATQKFDLFPDEEFTDKWATLEFTAEIVDSDTNESTTATRNLYSRKKKSMDGDSCDNDEMCFDDFCALSNKCQDKPGDYKQWCNTLGSGGGQGNVEGCGSGLVCGRYGPTNPHMLWCCKKLDPNYRRVNGQFLNNFCDYRLT